MGRPLRVGIVSANWGMAAHQPAWRANGVEVAAVCTAHEETARAAAERHGIERAYLDYRQLVSDPSIDIVDVGTRPDLRRDMVSPLSHTASTCLPPPISPPISTLRARCATQHARPVRW